MSVNLNMDVNCRVALHKFSKLARREMGFRPQKAEHFLFCHTGADLSKIGRIYAFFWTHQQMESPKAKHRTQHEIDNCPLHTLLTRGTPCQAVPRVIPVPLAIHQESAEYSASNSKATSPSLISKPFLMATSNRLGTFSIRDCDASVRVECQKRSMRR